MSVRPVRDRPYHVRVRAEQDVSEVVRQAVLADQHFDRRPERPPHTLPLARRGDQQPGAARSEPDLVLLHQGSPAAKLAPDRPVRVVHEARELRVVHPAAPAGDHHVRHQLAALAITEKMIPASIAYIPPDGPSGVTSPVSTPTSFGWKAGGLLAESTMNWESNAASV